MSTKRRSYRPLQLLDGSTRAAPGVVTGTLLAGWEGEFTVTLLVRTRGEVPAAVRSRSAFAAVRRRRRGDPYSSTKRDIRLVKDFALAHGLHVISADPARHALVVRGAAYAYNSAFGVALSTLKTGENRHRIREGDIYVPSALRHVLKAVVGLDNRPFARAHVRYGPIGTRISGVVPTVGAAAGPVEPAGEQVPEGLSPLTLAELYNLPPEWDGTGQTIAIVECGGGFRPEELDTYFKSLNLKPPRVSVATFPGGGTNSPGVNPLDPCNCDVEVMLDIQIAGAIAPGADIVVYFARDGSSQSFITTFNAILHDTANRPSVISLSWGGPEELTTAQFKDQFDQLLQEAGSLGITVCVSSGDNASADYDLHDPRWDKKPHVDFPASSPWVLACGGTRLHLLDQKIEREEVWYDGANEGTGGGISSHFEQPAYQVNAMGGLKNGKAMRGVPDVAGNAAPSSGFRILCDGQTFPDRAKSLPPVGGTSAVAPVWAGLIARLNQALNTRLGHLNPLLYQLAAKGDLLTEIVQGSNGDYTASSGWNPCTGLGRPDGAKLLQALTQAYQNKH